MLARLSLELNAVCCLSKHVYELRLTGRGTMKYVSVWAMLLRLDKGSR